MREMLNNSNTVLPCRPQGSAYSLKIKQIIIIKKKRSAHRLCTLRPHTLSRVTQCSSTWPYMIKANYKPALEVQRSNQLISCTFEVHRLVCVQLILLEQDVKINTRGYFFLRILNSSINNNSEFTFCCIATSYKHFTYTPF